MADRDGHARTTFVSLGLLSHQKGPLFGKQTLFLQTFKRKNQIPHTGAAGSFSDDLTGKTTGVMGWRLKMDLRRWLVEGHHLNGVQVAISQACLRAVNDMLNRTGSRAQYIRCHAIYFDRNCQ